MSQLQREGYEDGYADGLRGRNPDVNPYIIDGTDYELAYGEGYLRGLDALAAAVRGEEERA